MVNMLTIILRFLSKAFLQGRASEQPQQASGLNRLFCKNLRDNNWLENGGIYKKMQFSLNFPGFIKIDV